MKRSEMIKQLDNYIITMYSMCGNSLVWHDQAAEEVLRFIEDAGMLPPKHFKADSLNMEEPHMSGYHGLNGWETENE